VGKLTGPPGGARVKYGSHGGGARPGVKSPVPPHQVSAVTPTTRSWRSSRYGPRKQCSEQHNANRQRLTTPTSMNHFRYRA